MYENAALSVVGGPTHGLAVSPTHSAFCSKLIGRAPYKGISSSRQEETTRTGAQFRKFGSLLDFLGEVSQTPRTSPLWSFQKFVRKNPENLTN